MNDLADPDTIQALSTLFECGFINFEQNYGLLVKYGMNVEAAIAQLCEQL